MEDVSVPYVCPEQGGPEIVLKVLSSILVISSYFILQCFIFSAQVEADRSRPGLPELETLAYVIYICTQLH